MHPGARDPERRRKRLSGPGLLLALVLLLSACAPLETASVLWDLADGPDGRGGHLLSDDPARTPVDIPVRDGRIAGDLYIPADPTGAGLVLLPGLTPAGKDDARLVDFAATLARARFTVLVPELSGRRSLSAGTRDVPEILAAVDHLSARQGGRPVLVAGISYAAGPALLAALHPRGRERIGGVLALGGYRDMAHMIAWVTTGQRREEGRWVAGAPPDLAVWHFLRGNLHLLDDPGDRALLAEMARRRGRDPQAPIDDLSARLGAEGRAVLDLILNEEPGRAPDLIAALPARLRAELAALDLAGRDLSDLSAPLLLVHGKDDPIIPWTESADLARAAGGDRAELFLIERLGHTAVGDVSLDDLRTLWRAVDALLAARDRLAQEP